jgi:sugar lactone lactonase YvrE
VEPRILLSGLVFGESVRWHDGQVWFADWGAHQVVRLGPDGVREVVLTMPTFPFSLDWLPDGRLLVVSSTLQRLGPDGALVDHADLSPLAAGWNELVVDGRGNSYVNEVGFDLMSGAEPATGTVALVTADGEVRRVADGLWFPNGMALTADGRTLVVAESYRNRLTAFDVDARGDLGGRRLWADCGDGVPDGICLDAEGACWYADVPNRRCVRVAEGGTVLATVDVDRGCFSCALGGPDGTTLFVVATRWDGTGRMFEGDPTGQLLAVEVDVPAVTPPPPRGY